jgi:ATP-binding cassette subfamily C protein
VSDTKAVAAYSRPAATAFDDPRQCWRARDGKLDLFVVPVGAGGDQIGTGRYLFTLEAGGIGFGVAPCRLADGARVAIRASGPASLSVTASPNREFAAGPAAAEIDDWLLQFAGAWDGADAPDVAAQPDLPGQQAVAGKRIGPPRGQVLWLEPERGMLVPLGRPDAGARPGDPPLLVCNGSWVLATELTVFSAVSTATLVTRDRERFWQAFEQANAVLLAAIADDFTTRQARETARIEGRLRLNAAAFATGLRRIGAVLHGHALPDVADAVDHPLFAAAALVAARQHITLKPLPLPPLVDPGEYLEMLCRAARINVRPVSLDRDWYRRDNGPLVGFAGRDGGAVRPLALLPLGAARYEAFDPDGGDRVAIGPREAASLLPTAYMFYRGLEDAPLKASGLVRFGLAGMGRDLARVLGMGLLGGLLSLALPAISDPLFSDVLPRADTSTLVAVVLALAMAALGAAAFELVRALSLLRVEGRMEAGIQAAVWDRLLRLPTGFFRNYTTGDLADRVTGVTAIRSVITSVISGPVLDAMFSVVSFALMFWYSWQLALVATGLALVAVLVTVALTAVQLPHQRALMRDIGRVGGLTYQLLTAIGKLRVAGAEARAFGRWADVLAQQKRYAYRARRVAAAQQTWAQVFPPVTSVVLYIAMIRLGTAVPDQRATLPLLSLGAYMAFNAAFGQFVAALMSVVSGLTSLVTVVPLYERVRPVLRTVPETRDNAEPPGTLSGDIEFRRVVFRYLDDMPPVLDDVSFHLRPGEYVGVVGPSGGGKSTLVRLMLGFEVAQSGGVFFDQKDVATLDLVDVRRQIGVVLQSAGLLAGSLYENIVGSLPIPLEAAWDAARLAGLDADIRAMPMGMHTVLSDSAPTLSGGQRQRLIIARALVRKPRMLIFDEATSALDNRTQAIVNQTLANLDLTRIVIAHRLSTIRGVDRILVLKQGRLVESGGYDELMARDGVFRELARQQLL